LNRKEYTWGEVNKRKINSDMTERNNELVTLYNDDTEIRYVYHISDIHIRNTQRHNEYKEVFKRTYEKIRKEATNDTNCLIVLTGDIMHLKTEMSPESIDISYTFFESLTKIAPVILIAGNHDCNLSNKDRMDALTPIVEKIGRFANLYYLKYSGIYRYNNIIFGVSSLLDGEFIYAKSINDKIIGKINQQNKYKIALYHGMLKGSKMDNGYVTKNDNLTIKYFEGYDYVMLGDLHTHQFVNSRKTMAYAGSLIQQTHGESLYNHGILKWDLLRKRISLITVDNDYGFCTVHIKDGKMVDTHIPKNPTIRFILENTDQLQYKNIENNLEKEYNICGSSQENIKYYDPSGHQKYYMDSISDELEETKINSFLKTKNIKKNDRSQIIRLHNNIEKRVLNDNKCENIHNNKWKILLLNFSNMMSFGTKNVIDFRNYNTNQIIGIFAPNHYGKSSILDIILFCIFDKCTRGERRDILNKNKSDMYCGLLLEIGNQKYLIEKKGRRTKMSVKIDIKFYRIMKDENGNKIKEDLSGVDKNDTNRNITKLLGSYEDYLTTCICIQQQGKHGNFIDMTQLQKKEYLSEILKLNIFDQCCTTAKDKLKSYAIKFKFLEKEINTISVKNVVSNIKKIKNKILKMNKMKQHINKNLKILNKSLQFIKMPELIMYNELSIYDLDTDKKIIKTMHDLLHKINKCNPSNLQKKISMNQKSILDLKKENNYDILISKSNAKLEKLYTKIVNIPEITTDLCELIRKQKKIQTEINTIDLSLASMKADRSNIQQNKISEIKKEISKLKKCIKHVSPESEMELQILTQKLKENQLQLFETSYNYLNNMTIDQNQRKELVIELRIKKTFAKHVNKTIDSLDLYTKKNTKEVMDLQYKWLEDYNQWKIHTVELINNDTSKLPSIEKVLKKSNKINKNIIDKSCDVLALHDNNITTNEISKLENRIDVIEQINKKINQKEMLNQKLEIINDNINNLELYNKHIISNDKLNDKIKKIKDEIKTLETNRLENKNTIRKIKSRIEKYNIQLSNSQIFKNHVQMLELYQIHYYEYIFKKKRYEKIVNEKNTLELELNNINNQINIMMSELTINKNIIKQFNKSQKKYEQIKNKVKLYETYSKVMDFNGIPYEILKTALPQIETKVNQILHNMVNFNVEFLFYDVTKIDGNTTKHLKTNIGTINIIICHPNEKPCSVQMASGFEKFIIGLAIRMALCSVSKNAKPNFFVIDEGWSCLDKENLSNIDTIMNYIKNQFEHVIIISHLEELKNQADYRIDIDKHNGFSRVDNQKKIIINKKKTPKYVQV